MTIKGEEFTTEITEFTERSGERTQPAGDEFLGAAGDDQFLGGGTQRRECERFSVECENGFGVIDCDLRADSRRRAVGQDGAQVRHQLGTLEHDETVIERVAFVSFRKTAGYHARNSFELQRGRSEEHTSEL